VAASFRAWACGECRAATGPTLEHPAWAGQWQIWHGPMRLRHGESPMNTRIHAVSGGRSLNLSSGASVSIGHDDLVYGVVLLPVHQQVNGIQLVPRYSLALGWTHAL
jgi:hypothetical protein